MNGWMNGWMNAQNCLSVRLFLVSSNPDFTVLKSFKKIQKSKKRVTFVAVLRWRGQGIKQTAGRKFATTK